MKSRPSVPHGANLLLLESIQSPFRAVCSTQERYLPKFSATSDVWYCILKPIVCQVLVLPGDRYIEEKQTELETENKQRDR